jgi:phage terminase large subunit
MANFQVPEALEFLLPSMPGKFVSEGEGKRTLAAYGGRGSGKSHSAGRGVLARCCIRPTRWLNAREFQSSIRESTHQLYCTLIEQLGLGSEFEIQRDQILGPHGSVLSYVGLHDKSLDNLKSYEGYDGCLVEEAQSITKRSLQFLKPTIRKDGSQMIYLFNPESETDPIYEELVANPPPNAIVRKVNWYDNPWFNSILMDEMKLDYERDPDAADWIWGGNCRKNSDKLVLRGKCEMKPFTPDPVLWDGPYHGLDFGYAADPMHATRCWIWEGDLYIEQEAFAENLEIEDHPSILDSITDARDQVMRCDNARPEMVSFIRRQGFKRAMSCKKWPGYVEDRIDFLRSFHKIIIHPNCPHIDMQRKLWSWKVDKAGNVLNVLMPGNDHGWDAVVYSLEPHILGYKKKIGTREQPALLDDLGQPIRSAYRRMSSPNAWMT